jgi:tRNA(Ile)-lysidine synthase
MTRLEQALEKLSAYVQDKQLLLAGAKLLLCVSGGADSVALLQLFSRLRSRVQLTLLAVHVDHQLRGGESSADAELVKELCQGLNVPVIVRKIKLESQGDLENRARKLRFEAFNQILEAYKFDYIVTAHHNNDQTETMLMNLFRGAGLSGLAGIRPRSGNILHPLLCFTRDELVNLLTEEKVQWRDDSSNADQRFRRNWIRHSLLPLLEKEINPRLGSTLGRQAQIFSEAEEMMLQRTRTLSRKIILEQDADHAVLSLPGLTRCLRLEQYYILRELIFGLSGSSRDFFSCSFEEVIALAQSEGSKYTRLHNGLVARRQYDELVIEKSVPAQPIPEDLSVDEDRGRAIWGDHRFSFKVLRVLPEYRNGDPLNVYLDADKIRFPFTIRGRRPGDRFMPFGMDKLVRLKEFLINLKVPRIERGLVPIFDDGEKIFWIAGHRIDARVAIDEASTRYLHISAEDVRQKPARAASRKKTGE